MALTSTLVKFGLYQVLGDFSEEITDWFQARLNDPSRKLEQALTQAHDRAWQVLELALQEQAPLLARIDKLRWFPSSSLGTRDWKL